MPPSYPKWWSYNTSRHNLFFLYPDYPFHPRPCQIQLLLIQRQTMRWVTTVSTSSTSNQTGWVCFRGLQNQGPQILWCSEFSILYNKLLLHAPDPWDCELWSAVIETRDTIFRILKMLQLQMRNYLLWDDFYLELRVGHSLCYQMLLDPSCPGLPPSRCSRAAPSLGHGISGEHNR